MIPDEAVEAAARGLAQQKWPTAIGVWDSFGQNMQDGFRDQARAALEAAAPHLMRVAWDEGWEAHGDWGGPTPNPYAKGLAAQERAEQ